MSPVQAMPGPSCCSGAGDQPVHPLQVPGRADNAPLAPDSLDAAQAELLSAQAHHNRQRVPTCTNASRDPSSGTMNPKPFSWLNHLTVPVVIKGRSRSLKILAATAGRLVCQRQYDCPPGEELIVALAANTFLRQLGTGSTSAGSRLHWMNFNAQFRFETADQCWQVFCRLPASQHGNRGVRTRPSRKTAEKSGRPVDLPSRILSLQAQLDAFSAGGCERTFEARASGTHSNRPGLLTPELRRQAEAMLQGTKGYPFVSDVARGLPIGRTAFYHYFPKERIRELKG